MASYRYLRDIRPEELEQDKQQPLTRHQKMRNWWHYHWGWVAAGIVLAGFGAYYAAVMLGRASLPEPDYEIGILAQEADVLREETLQEWELKLASYADDRNGDGQVLVQIACFAFSLDNGTGGDLYQEYANAAGMIQAGSALQEGECCILLMDDPVGIQSYTGILCNLDGTLASREETDWTKMCRRLRDCPGLGEILTSKDLTEEEKSLLEDLYAGAVNPMEEQKEQRESWRSFWRIVTDSPASCEYKKEKGEPERC